MKTIFNSRFNFLNAVIALATVAVLSACGGGGGGSDSTPNQNPAPSPSQELRAINGVAVKGKLVNATIAVYQLAADGSKVTPALATTTTDVDGKYGISIPKSITGPVAVVATNGQFIDEATGDSVTLADGESLEAFTFINNETTLSVNVTPLTSLAAAKARQLVKAGIHSFAGNAIPYANSQLASLLGIDDLLTTRIPALSEINAATQSERHYALFLAGFSQLGANDPGRTTMDVVASMVSDFETFGGFSASNTIKVGDFAIATSTFTNNHPEITTGVSAVVLAKLNGQPTATDDQASTDEDVVLTIASATLLANDFDPDNDTLSIVSVASTANTRGAIELQGSNVVFTPATNYSGNASFTYYMTDGNGNEVPATVYVTIHPINDAPIATNDDAGNTPEDTALVIVAADLLANDSDVEGDALSVTAVSATAETHGDVTLSGGQITYTPAANFVGQARFQYTVRDANGASSQALVSVTVTAVNDAPVAVNDQFDATEDQALQVTVAQLLSNDFDVDSGDTISIVAVNATADTRGTVGLSSGNVTFTPTANFFGATSFEYVIVDSNGATATATAFINVVGVPDAPTISGTPAVTVGVGQQYSFTPIASDADSANEVLTFSIQNKPTWATFSTTSGKLSGTPTTANASTTTQNIVISVSDSTNLKASLPAFDLLVIPTVATPSIDPGNGSFTGTVSVTLAVSTANSTIRYTLDGTDPSETSPSYTAPFSVSDDGTTREIRVKAKAYRDGYASSTIATASFILSPSFGGSLSGTMNENTAATNLTVNGTADWAHWGLNSSVDAFNRKAGVQQLISNYSSLLETSPSATLASGDRSYNWTGGTPTASASNVRTGLFTKELNNGFELTVPATSTQRTLRLYVGAFRATGTLSVALSDDSAVDYVASIDNQSDESKKTVTIKFASAVEGSLLHISYKLTQQAQSNGNITLEAATLDGTAITAAPAFVPPPGAYTDMVSVTMTSATPSAQIYYTTDGTEPTAQSTLYTSAIDLAATTTLKARAFKNGLVASPITTGSYVVNPSAGGSMSAYLDVAPPSVDLTAEGVSDWVHFAYDSVTAEVRKSAVPLQVSSYSKIGSGTVSFLPFSDDSAHFGWSDGAPVTSAKDVTSGLFIKGANNGFRFSVPAGSTPRMVKVYLGAFNSKAKVTATLSDASVSPYVVFVDAPNTVKNPVLNISYTASASGESLMIEIIADSVYATNGNVSLHGATLEEKKVVAPFIGPNGSSLYSGEEIILSSKTAGATIYYTTDGSTPTTASQLYSAPFTLAASATVKAIALKDGFINSTVSSKAYTLVVSSCTVAPRIMPLGDSITFGTNGGTGPNVAYRQKLYGDLMSASYNVNFVGGLVDGQTALPPFDTDHEGHGGYRIADISANVTAYLQANPSDVVLLHIGTNDLSGPSGTTTADGVSQILDKVFALNSNTRVVLARIINQRTPKATITEFNSNVAAMAAARIAKGDRVRVVNMEAALTYPTDMFDSLHPTPSGYQKMATTWYGDLASFLPTCVQ